MRTTVDIPEHLLFEAKRIAASRRVSLARIVEASLRAYVAEEHRSAASTATVPPLPVVRRCRLIQGVDLDDTSALLDLA